MSIPDLHYELLDPDRILGGEGARACVGFLAALRKRSLGWHYLVDLAWIYEHARHWPVGSRVLDVGGGAGPTQFLLAELGMEVVNVDLTPVAADRFMRARYSARESTSSDWERNDYVDHLARNYSSPGDAPGGRLAVRRSGVLRLLRAKWMEWQLNRWRRRHGFSGRPLGSLRLVRGDATRLSDFPPASFDAIVSLSSIEHIPLERLPALLAELVRVLRPDGRVAMTTSATDRTETWFHEPSRGYCYASHTLESLFGATRASNIDAQVMLGKYRDCAYLRDNLADFYFASGSNGMPWGTWDPQYVPVGLSR